MGISRHRVLVDSTKHTWDHLRQVEMSLRGPFVLPPLQRHGDRFIMDDLMNHTPAFSCKNMLLFRWIRSLLQVNRLSDIVTVDGLRIGEEILRGDRLNRVNHYDWPREHPI